MSGEATHHEAEAREACERMGFALGFWHSRRGEDSRRCATEARARLLAALQKGLLEGTADGNEARNRPRRHQEAT